MFAVYLLKSLRDGKQYIGSTKNLGKRLEEHNAGKVRSTKYRRPFVLMKYQECTTIKEAASLEKKYKKNHGALNRAIKNGLFVETNNGE